MAVLQRQSSKALSARKEQKKKEKQKQKQQQNGEGVSIILTCNKTAVANKPTYGFFFSKSAETVFDQLW